jgi:hypothetical protein
VASLRSAGSGTVDRCWPTTPIGSGLSALDAPIPARTVTRVRYLLTCLLAVALFTAACGDNDSNETESTTSTTLQTPTGVPASIGGIIDGEPSGDINVLGYVVIDQNGSRFCAVLRESFPPQCGTPSVDLVDLDTAAVDLQQEQDVQWTDDIVVLLGRYSDGTFTVLDVG